MEEMIINMALSILLGVIKNPNKVAGLKKALRKLRAVLNSIDLDEPIKKGGGFLD